ncbi:hypothetical protein ACNHKD_12940 [Methylocystis sp. JAN1]|uniref:hypothetical protein n=1 Tax=Methylocystis sp. JAN1 TaxID=3397211 RepID=UPI003FA283FE
MTSNVVKFKSRHRLAAEEMAFLARGHVAVCKTRIPDMGWKRLRWVVITVFLDGTSDWEDGPKDERTALFVAEVRARKYGFKVVNWGVLK